MPTPPIYYIRHGETDWNAEHRYQGQRDIPLNKTGEQQARRNGKVLAELLDDPAGTNLFCSPMTRTRQTLDLVLETSGWADTDWARNVLFDDRLIEFSFGDWEGWTLEEIKQREPELYWEREADKWTTCMPNGESYQMLAERIGGWFRSLDKPTVVVAHGGVLRIVRYFLENVPELEAPMLKTPQDKIYFWSGSDASWI
ncbi:histidine phosphatase family protein [uncultured Cohaesibacter sp.]|uniref:histidine phosphatase family protein n=1 Tax=uncultured Cohaesibacter sp. TaxID=1002546 RepID=UPI00292FAD16|nr:histidine phosphatase family protein [uncultured Cohaesibacter sp.]